MDNSYTKATLNQMGVTLIPTIKGNEYKQWETANILPWGAIRSTVGVLITILQQSKDFLVLLH